MTISVRKCCWQLRTWLSGPYNAMFLTGVSQSPHSTGKASWNPSILPSQSLKTGKEQDWANGPVSVQYISRNRNQTQSRTCMWTNARSTGYILTASFISLTENCVPQLSTLSFYLELVSAKVMLQNINKLLTRSRFPWIAQVPQALLDHRNIFSYRHKPTS